MRRIEMIIGMVMLFVGGCAVMDDLGNLQLGAIAIGLIGGVMLLHSSREELC